MSQRSRIRLEVASDTDLGLERENNQDTIFQWTSNQNLSPPRALLLLADGMGGHQKGEVASQITVEKHKEILIPKLSGQEIENEIIIELLENALLESNKSISEYAIDNGITLQDIGTTLDCVVLFGKEMFFSHVGDGRIYLLKKLGLNQLTTDHSVVEEMAKAGLIRPEEIYTHPQRNLLTKGLGGNVKIDIKIEKIELTLGDRVLMCSDGLWGLIRDNLLERILLWASPPHVLVKELVIAAKEAGGNDNISVIICDILPAS
ncbi:MAG: protein phosphatase 2C domain-containing protein [Anaerolineales bacterium]